MSIPVYIVNLKKRTDRKKSVVDEFYGKNQFDVTICEPLSHPIGSYSLWKTFQDIVLKCKQQEYQYFIFCEDDHIFTEYYSESVLFENIQTAIRYDADILLGGVSWFDLPIQCEQNLFYVDQFNGMQFSVIFSSLYDKILDYRDTVDTIVDLCISNLSSNIFVMWPFLSIQKEFGYSDVTSFNNTPNYVNHLFEKTSKELCILNKVREFYRYGK